MRRFQAMLLGTALSAITVQPLFGAVLEMNYQGRLLDASGQPINANVTVSISIYTNDISGSPVYEEAVGPVPVQDGVYSFRFGNGLGAREALLHGECWLELNIDGTTLQPRQKLVAVPYSVVSHQVENVDSNTTFSAGVVSSNAIQNGAVTSSKLASGQIGAQHLSNSVEDRFVNEDGDSVAWLDVTGTNAPGQYIFRIFAGSNSVAWARTKPVNEKRKGELVVEKPTVD